MISMCFARCGGRAELQYTVYVFPTVLPGPSSDTWVMIGQDLESCGEKQLSLLAAVFVQLPYEFTSSRTSEWKAYERHFIGSWKESNHVTES